MTIFLRETTGVIGSGSGVEVKIECFLSVADGSESSGEVISFFPPLVLSGIGFFFFAGILPGLEVCDGSGDRSLVLLEVVVDRELEWPLE